MSKTATVRARIEPDLKDRVEQRDGLPFSVSLPDAVTLKTFEDTDAVRHLTVCQDADDMFKKLGRAK